MSEDKIQFIPCKKCGEQPNITNDGKFTIIHHCGQYFKSRSNQWWAAAQEWNQSNQTKGK